MQRNRAEHAARLRRGSLATAVLLLISLVALPIRSALGEAARVESGPWFDWSMPDRYGVDADRDGLVDMPNTPAYVSGDFESDCDPICPGPVFPVAFEAHLGDVIVPNTFPIQMDPLITYEWAIRSAGGSVETFGRHTPELVVSLPEGRAVVTLRVVFDLPFQTFSLLATEVIDVNDILIVAIGDSYASGEGNPELRRGIEGADPSWGDGIGNEGVGADHAQARRSSLAWPSQLALDLERANGRTSVTFISVAASSATIDKGLLGPQNSRLPLAQVPRVAEMVGEREIDLLLVSIGGNDIGFSRLIAELVDADAWLDPICYDNDLQNIWSSIRDGEWNRASRLSWKITDPFRVRCRTVRTDNGVTLAGLNGLSAELDRLAMHLNQTLDANRILIMEYPDPTGFSDGNTTDICDEIVGDAAPLGLHEISQGEQRLGRSEVLDPLNQSLQAAAARHGWGYVKGVVPAFTDGHGYCAEWPDYGYPPDFASRPALLRDRLDHPDAWYLNGGLAGTATQSGPVSWYRTAGQSVVLQGPDSRVDTTGTMHPNELGHRALANLALAVLARG